MNCPNNGKIQYESQEDAEDALRVMRKKYLDCDSESYYCMYCSKWHLGSRTKKPRKKRKRT